MSQHVEPQEEVSADQSDSLVSSSECCGTFRFFVDGQRWEWSDAVARMHGYEPGSVVPTTELLLQHKHPEDRPRVAAVLDRVIKGGLFSSRHRIIDTAGRTHWVVVVGDSMRNAAGNVIGTSGFYIDVTEELQSDITTVLSETIEARARIEQAKGLLMTAYGISSERAFEILVWRSQQTNTKVRDLAGQFLTALTGRMSPDTLSHVDHALLTLHPAGTESGATGSARPNSSSRNGERHRSKGSR
jgi:PAS domain S-box-containing protein